MLFVNTCNLAFSGGQRLTHGNEVRGVTRFSLLPSTRKHLGALGSPRGEARRYESIGDDRLEPVISPTQFVGKKVGFAHRDRLGTGNHHI
jgi:hypothetical protein